MIGSSTAFKTAEALSQSAQTKTDKEREDITQLHPDAQSLAAVLCDTVEFFHRKDPTLSSPRRAAPPAR